MVESQRVLYLAVLAQAVYDVLDDSNEEATETAWVFLSGHVKLLRKLRKLSSSEREAWKAELEAVLGE